MQGVKNAISLDHHEKLDEQFSIIADLINKDQLQQACSLLSSLHPADLADFLDNHKSDYQDILPLLSDQLKPEVLIWISESNKEAAIESLGLDKAAYLIDLLDLEDAIEVIEALNEELKESVISKLPIEKGKQISEGFKYPENTVGRILERDFLSLRHNYTVGQALEYISNKKIKTDCYAAIVTDSRFRPIGTMLLSALLQNPKDTILSQLMNKDCMIVDPNTDVEEIAFLFKQYALTIVPVVNKQGKLMGSISIDNMIYIVGEQTENEFLHLGGINNSDIFDDLYKTSKSRFPWLFVNLIIACVTCLVIDHFSDTIAHLITVATVMPIVASMGGNAGTQVMTVTLHAISNREISASNSIKVVTKEIYVCIVNGAILSIIGGGITYLLFWHINLSLVFAASVLITFAFAGFLGSAIPIILDEMNIDPTTASSVFLTAGTDSIGFFTFLGLTYFFLV